MSRTMGFSVFDSDDGEESEWFDSDDHPNDQLLSAFDDNEKHFLILTPEVGVPLFARLKKYLVDKELLSDDEETENIKEISLADCFYFIHIGKYGKDNYSGGTVESGGFEDVDGQIYFGEFIKEAKLLAAQMGITDVRWSEVLTIAVSETYFVISYGSEEDKAGYGEDFE